MKKILYFFTCFALLGSLPLAAQRNRNRNNQALQRAIAEKKKKEAAEKAKRDKINGAIDDFLKDHDRNKDGSVTLEEFSGSAAGNDAESKFAQYNKNRDRYLSKKEIQELLGL